MHLGEQGEPHGAVVLAEEQTAGRGRAGRNWLSEKSAGIHCTVLLRPQISPAHAPLLTLVAGLAARDAVAEELDAAPDIRWPNDLLVGGSKFCGILTEMHAEPDRMHYAVVGIGINVNQTKMPAELAEHRHFAAHGNGENSFAAGTADSVAAAPGPLLQSVPRGRRGRRFCARFAEVSSYFQGKRVRITTATERLPAPRPGWSRAACCACCATMAARIEAGAFRATWPRRTDAVDARRGQHEHGAGRFSRQRAGRELAADHGARSNRRRIRHSDARSVHAWRISSRAKSAA